MTEVSPDISRFFQEKVFCASLMLYNNLTSENVFKWIKSRWTIQCTLISFTALHRGRAVQGVGVTASILGPWVRIPLKSWVFVRLSLCCAVCGVGGLTNGLPSIQGNLPGVEEQTSETSFSMSGLRVNSSKLCNCYWIDLVLRAYTKICSANTFSFIGQSVLNSRVFKLHEV
jgi:hypothetical protein